MEIRFASVSKHRATCRCIARRSTRRSPSSVMRRRRTPEPPSKNHVTIAAVVLRVRHDHEADHAAARWILEVRSPSGDDRRSYVSLVGRHGKQGTVETGSTMFGELLEDMERNARDRAVQDCFTTRGARLDQAKAWSV